MDNNEEKLIDEAEYGEQVRIRREKLKALCEEGANPFEQTNFKRTARSSDVTGDFSAYENKRVAIAGRVLSRRIMGKASFAHILDSEGQIQIYVKIDNVGAEAYEDWKKSDIGDIYGVEGTVFMTHKGEVSVSGGQACAFKQVLASAAGKMARTQGQRLEIPSALRRSDCKSRG